MTASVGAAVEHGLRLVVTDPGPWALRSLTVDRTVDRVFVHRRALSEVLLTDARQVDRDRFVAAAQLPRGHFYYGDHTGDQSVLDPVLLFEVCRQAGLYASHCYEGVSQRCKFILTHLDFERHHAARAVELPCRLVVEATVVDRRWWQNQVSGIDLELALAVPDGPVGVVRLGLRYRSPDAYLAMRLRSRDGRALESTESFRPSHVQSLVAPRKVGRHRRENVIIGDLSADGRGHDLRGVLRVPAGHPSMFDHAQDHIPGMVLTEAARQLALYAAAEEYGWPATRTYVDRMQATFQRFGELEPDTVLRASTGGPPTSWRLEPELAARRAAGRAALDLVDGIPVSVEITQHGEPICTASAVVATPARHPRQRQQP